MINVSELSERLHGMISGAKFVGLTYRAKGTGELARHTLILNSSYRNLLVNSIEKLSALDKVDFELIQKDCGVDFATMEIARLEVLASLQKSLTAFDAGEQSEDYTKRGQYAAIAPNLKMNLNDNTFEVSGLSHSKVVLETGEYKEVKSKPVTIAKNSIRKWLPISKFRTFAVDVESFASMRMNGETLELA
jgi:hypothetical protein